MDTRVKRLWWKFTGHMILQLEFQLGPSGTQYVFHSNTNSPNPQQKQIQCPVSEWQKCPQRLVPDLFLQVFTQTTEYLGFNSLRKPLSSNDAPTASSKIIYVTQKQIP
jgi:hypothetical protein